MFFFFLYNIYYRMKKRRFCYKRQRRNSMHQMQEVDMMNTITMNMITMDITRRNTNTTTINIMRKRT